MTKENISDTDDLPKETIEITVPSLIMQVMHEKKQLILKEIFKEGRTIQELKNLTKMNPGTVKRHLDELMKHKLVFVEREDRNAYNILMKYYRTTAKHFEIHFRLPEDIPEDP
ncbi:MAG: winged helix-turn-helix domain-containing protein [Promethearchaeota archaeon]